MSRRTTDLDLAAAWIRAVCHKRAVCAACGTRRRLQGHHAIPQQVLRRFGQERRLGASEIQRIVWDPRVGVALCATCHARHDLAVARLPRAKLPRQVFEFAVELDALVAPRQPMQRRIERYYP